MTRKLFLKALGAGALALAGLGTVGKAVAGALLQPGRLLRAGHRRFAITHAIERIGEMTPDQLDRALFESGLSEQFDLGAELAAMVEEGVLRQSVAAEGIVYRPGGTAVPRVKLSADEIAQIDSRLDALKTQFEAESDYIAQYTESSTGMVPLFLSIRQGATILLKVNIVVDDVATAKVVTRNWMKNAHRTRRAVWESIGEGTPFPTFQSIREVR
jgi:hypothetical protein